MFSSRGSWCLYKMVTKHAARAPGKISLFGKEEKIRILTTLDLIKCLKEIK